jgi:hypothetical protein
MNDFLFLAVVPPPALVAPFVKKGCRLSVLDRHISLELEALSEHCAEVNLNEFDFKDLPDAPPYNTVLALDIIEHLLSPESFLEDLRQSPCLRGSHLILTTPNVTFLPVRLMFLFGFFNYGKRGILDRTHTRLFTFGSLQRLLRQAGFTITSLQGIPAPFPLAFGRKSWIGKFLLKTNQIMARIWPGLFSYQIYCEATPSSTVERNLPGQSLPWIVVLVSVMLINVGLLWWYHDRTWWEPDEGQLAHVAERILHGEVLHRDIQDVRPGYVKVCATPWRSSLLPNRLCCSCSFARTVPCWPEPFP